MRIQAKRRPPTRRPSQREESSSRDHNESSLDVTDDIIPSSTPSQTVLDDNVRKTISTQNDSDSGIANSDSLTATHPTDDFTGHKPGDSSTKLFHAEDELFSDSSLTARGEWAHSGDTEYSQRVLCVNSLTRPCASCPFVSV